MKSKGKNISVLNIFYNFQQGGVERLGITVANSLAKKGINSHVCIINDNYSEQLINKFISEVNIHFLKKTRNRKLGYLIQLVDIIRSNHINVIHVHQGDLFPFFAILKLCCPKVKVYYTVHDTFIFSQLKKRNQVIAECICEKLIAISNAVKDDIIKNGCNPSKIERVYNGVDFSDFKYVDRSKRLVDRTYKIINVARFFPEKKGQDILINAAALLVNEGYRINVYFAGAEPDDITGEISRMKKLAKTLNVEDKIMFLGNIDNVADLLYEGDVFCIPSRYEGFGISAVEAMSTGLPCVASDIIGLNEVVNDRRLGEKVLADNATALGEGLKKVLDNYGRFDGRYISENMHNRFSIDNMTDLLLSIYRKSL